MHIEGGCYCGAIRYEFDGDIANALQCHCRECQYITGGNPNVLTVIPRDNLKFTKGATTTFTREDLEQPVTRHFCPQCGTAIGSTFDHSPAIMALKVGTMDDPSFFAPQIAIFTKDAQSFHHIPSGIPTFEGSPG